MRWSRDLVIARRSLRTAMRAASAMTSRALPASPRLMPRAADAVLGTGHALVEMTDFGSNPGRLSMFVSVPPRRPDAAVPMVVLLHGCGQCAGDFAREAGWIDLSDRLGFPLVLPEQSGDNNQGRCFNWFRPMQTGRGLGEVLSIRQMVDTAITRFGGDPGRVFVAGLSAGGAMAAALLAAYPDVFAGGAAVAGLPVGAAASAAEALLRMADAGPARSPIVWADQVRHAAPIGYSGPWPCMSVWHGEADRIVDPANARLLATQWAAVHGFAPADVETSERMPARQARWSRNGRSVVELWTLADQAHEWPAGATGRIAAFWGLPPD